LPYKKSAVRAAIGEALKRRSELLQPLPHAFTCIKSSISISKLVLFGYASVRFVDVLDAILKRFAFWWRSA
jgi:hypothetical protein